MQCTVRLYLEVTRQQFQLQQVMLNTTHYICLSGCKVSGIQAPAISCFCRSSLMTPPCRGECPSSPHVSRWSLLACDLQSCCLHCRLPRTSDADRYCSGLVPKVSMHPVITTLKKADQVLLDVQRTLTISIQVHSGAHQPTQKVSSIFLIRKLYGVSTELMMI